MRHLAITEIAHTSGGFGFDSFMSSCPYANATGWSLLGMVAGATYSHGYLKNNAKLLQWTLGAGIAAAAISLGLDYAQNASAAA